MDRFKDFNNTGVAPNGKLFAGDLTLFQDLVAALSDLTQHIDLGSISIGESGLQLLRFGSGEVRLVGRVRTDGYVMALGGVMPGAFTTTQRDAIPVGQRPTNLIIKNTTTGTFQYNAGSDGSPSWADLAPLASPAFTGNPTAPTAALNDNDTSIATTAWVRAEMQAAATKIRAKSGVAGQVEMGDVGVANAAGIAFSNVNPAVLQYDGTASLKINGPNSNFTADQIICNAQFIGPQFRPTGFPGLIGSAVLGVSISGAAITPTHWIQRVISSGTLSTINGGQDHAVLILINVSGGVVTYDTAGNIAQSGTIASNNHKMFVYLSSDSKWHPAN